MSYLPKVPEWAEGVYQLERNDPVSGGPLRIDEKGKERGTANKPLIDLANRTEWLKQKYDTAFDNLGWMQLGLWAVGLEVSLPTQIVSFDGSWYRYRGSLEVPHVIAGDSPEEDGGVWSGDNPDGVWVDVGDASLRVDLNSIAGSDIIGYILAVTGSVSRTVSERLRDSATILDFGAKSDGVTDDSAAILKMATAFGYVRLKDGTKTFLGSTIRLPNGMGVFGAQHKATLIIASGARIQATGATASASLTVTSSSGKIRIASSVDYTGKYLSLSNGLVDKMFAAETATPNSIDPIAISKDDNNFGSYKAGFYKVIGFDAAAQEIILDAPLDFNVIAQDAEIYDEVNYTLFCNIHFIDANTSPSPESSTIALRKNYKGGMIGCSGNINYLDVSYFNCCNLFHDNHVHFNVTFMVSYNGCRNIFSVNTFSSDGTYADGTLILFKNCRRNIVANNIIGCEWPTAREKWGLIFHTNSDYNIAVNNNVDAKLGIGDYAFNKGNIIRNNVIRCDHLVLLCLVNSSYRNNEIIASAPSSFVTSEKIDFSDNEVFWNGPVANAALELYDVATKPFGFAGFSVSPTRELIARRCKFTYMGEKTAIDFRTFINFSAGSANYFPTSSATWLANGVAAIKGNLIAGTRKFDFSHCTFTNFNVSLALTSDAVNLAHYYNVDGCEHENVDAAYIFKVSDINSTRQTLRVTNNKFRNVDAAGLSSNYPIYFKNNEFADVNSVLVMASYASTIYAHIIDIDNTFYKRGATKHYDFGANSANYLAALSTAHAHAFSYMIPRGARYYQPAENQLIAHSELFINGSYVLSGVPTYNTIKRAVSDVAYSSLS